MEAIGSRQIFSEATSAQRFRILTDFQQGRAEVIASQKEREFNQKKSSRVLQIAASRSTGLQWLQNIHNDPTTLLGASEALWKMTSHCLIALPRWTHNSVLMRTMR